jgi:hypothetical protein
MCRRPMSCLDPQSKGRSDPLEVPLESPAVRPCVAVVLRECRETRRLGEHWNPYR